MFLLLLWHSANDDVHSAFAVDSKNTEKNVDYSSLFVIDGKMNVQPGCFNILKNAT